MLKQKFQTLFQTIETKAVDSLADGVSEGLNQELAGCQFQDARLGRRFQKLVRQLAGKIGQSIPLACQDWVNTKAAYPLLTNRRGEQGAGLPPDVPPTGGPVAPL